MLEGLRRRLAASLGEVNAVRLQERFCDVDVSRIADAPARVPVRIVGEVAALQVVPRAGSSWLEVTVDDGSGRAAAVFSGRTRIAGIDPGRAILLEGVGRDEAGRLTMLNPAYTLLA